MCLTWAECHHRGVSWPALLDCVLQPGADPEGARVLLACHRDLQWWAPSCSRAWRMPKLRKPNKVMMVVIT